MHADGFVAILGILALAIAVVVLGARNRALALFVSPAVAAFDATQFVA